jgi:uncharacterized protein (DUF1800 family)
MQNLNINPESLKEQFVNKQIDENYVRKLLDENKITLEDFLKITNS